MPHSLFQLIIVVVGVAITAASVLGNDVIRAKALRPGHNHDGIFQRRCRCSLLRNGRLGDDQNVRPVRLRNYSKTLESVHRLFRHWMKY